MFKLLQCLPIPHKLRFKHLNCPTRSCMVDLAYVLLPAHLLSLALLCKLQPPWPSFSFLMRHISVLSGFHSWASQLRTPPQPWGVSCEPPACIRSPCHAFPRCTCASRVALYSSALTLCNSLVSTFLASLCSTRVGTVVYLVHHCVPRRFAQAQAYNRPPVNVCGMNA